LVGGRREIAMRGPFEIIGNIGEVETTAHFAPPPKPFSMSSLAAAVHAAPIETA
jgi:hypothetical protein